jgi:hypothetical protein
MEGQDILNYKKKYTKLKDLAIISGYAFDYVGYLIRTGKIPGKKIYSDISWKVSRYTILNYTRKNKKVTRIKLWKNLFGKKYISLKEASKISGYASDYIGFLIRAGKIPGKKIYSRINWVATEEAIKVYKDGRWWKIV